MVMMVVEVRVVCVVSECVGGDLISVLTVVFCIDHRFERGVRRLALERRFDVVGGDIQ